MRALPLLQFESIVALTDLSYFNRPVRWHYGAVPSEIRASALRENEK